MNQRLKDRLIEAAGEAPTFPEEELAYDALEYIKLLEAVVEPAVKSRREAAVRHVAGRDEVDRVAIKLYSQQIDEGISKLRSKGLVL